MSSFQMESLKVMEKFDGGNFHLWKFKMCMMISKHGLWKFVDGSATLPNEELARADYYEKKMKAFALLCEHLTDGQLAHIQYKSKCYDQTTKENLCPKSLMHFLQNVEFDDKQMRPIPHNKMVLRNVPIEPSWNVREA
jgi:hypothetical protein